MLLTLVFACLAVTIASGPWAARRVRDTADFAIAGRLCTLFGSWTLPSAAPAGAQVPAVIIFRF